MPVKPLNQQLDEIEDFLKLSKDSRHALISDWAIKIGEELQGRVPDHAISPVLLNIIAADIVSVSSGNHTEVLLGRKIAIGLLDQAITKCLLAYRL